VLGLITHADTAVAMLLLVIAASVGVAVLGVAVVGAAVSVLNWKVYLFQLQPSAAQQTQLWHDNSALQVASPAQ
jgi:hypothetical protein